jgi:hypothetical protein
MGIETARMVLQSLYNTGFREAWTAACDERAMLGQPKTIRDNETDRKSTQMIKLRDRYPCVARN